MFMQEILTNKKENKVSINTFSLEDKQRLVSAFVWLLEQDKKQNPALYQKTKIVTNDRHNMPTST